MALLPSEFSWVNKVASMKKDKKLTVRVCEGEYKFLKLKADLSGLSLQGFL